MAHTPLDCCASALLLIVLAASSHCCEGEDEKAFASIDLEVLTAEATIIAARIAAKVVVMKICFILVSQSANILFEYSNLIADY